MFSNHLSVNEAQNLLKIRAKTRFYLSAYKTV